MVFTPMRVVGTIRPAIYPAARIPHETERAVVLGLVSVRLVKDDLFQQGVLT